MEKVKYINRKAREMTPGLLISFISGVYSPGWIASVGHTSAHEPQSVQSSGSIT
jgi:hypothetical protein